MEFKSISRTSSTDNQAPIVSVEESSINLESMTKIQLEEHGRTLGIELDRRKKKATLIEEIKAAQ